MAEKFNTGTGGLLADPRRAWSYASQRGHLWVISGRGNTFSRCPLHPWNDPKHLFGERGLVGSVQAVLISSLKLPDCDRDVVLDVYEADRRIVPKGRKADRK